MVLVSGQLESEEFASDTLGADSQEIYRYVKLPAKSSKHISPLEYDEDYEFEFQPASKSSRPIYLSKAKAPKSVFSPNPKFSSFASHRSLNPRYKNVFFKQPSTFKKHQQLYKPVHPNFHTDLETMKLPLAESEFIAIRNPNPHDFKGNFKLQDVPNLYSLHREFLESASPKQILNYYEDQQKEDDEKLELQLLNDPSPQAKAKYQQFLKSKEDERIEKEYLEELVKKDRQPGTSYDPVRVEPPEFIKKPETPGLRHYRTLNTDPSAYEFEVTFS